LDARTGPLVVARAGRLRFPRANAKPPEREAPRRGPACGQVAPDSHTPHTPLAAAADTAELVSSRAGAESRLTAFRLQRLDHVSLNVSDRPRSIAWCRDVLGLELRNEPKADDWPAFMGEFGRCVGLFQAEEGPVAKRGTEAVGFRHLAFMVGKDDLD